jgi:hypothetical protein
MRLWEFLRGGGIKNSPSSYLPLLYLLPWEQKSEIFHFALPGSYIGTVLLHGTLGTGHKKMRIYKLPEGSESLSLNIE